MTVKFRVIMGLANGSKMGKNSKTVTVDIGESSVKGMVKAIKIMLKTAEVADLKK